MSLLVGTTSGLLSLDDPNTELIGGTRINHVRRDATGWWAVDGKSRIHHGGEIVATLPDQAPAICVQPTPETVWVGSSEARLFALDQGEVAEDEFFNEAPGRDSWYTPWGAPPDVRSMTLDVDHTLYINVHVGGILRYDNTGPIPTVDISADVHEVAAHPSQKGAIFAATAQGLAFSHNGHDFDFRTDGLHATYCRAVTVLEDRVVFSASTGPRSDRGRLYASPLWDDEIEPLTSGLPEWFDSNVDTHCLAVHQNMVYVGHGDQVWRSDDRGDNWAVVADGLARITCLA
jgi:hypothetical protein